MRGARQGNHAAALLAQGTEKDFTKLDLAGHKEWWGVPEDTRQALLFFNSLTGSLAQESPVESILGDQGRRSTIQD